MALGKDNLPQFRRVQRDDPPRLAKGVPPPPPDVSPVPVDADQEEGDD